MPVLISLFDEYTNEPFAGVDCCAVCVAIEPAAKAKYTGTKSNLPVGMEQRFTRQKCVEITVGETFEKLVFVRASSG